LSGELAFTRDTLSMRDATGRILGSPARFTVERDDSQGVRIRAAGRIDAATLRQQIRHPLAAQLAGAADWRATINLRAQRYALLLESDLVGLSAALPAPLGKAARTALPLRVERRERTPELDNLSLSLGTLLSAQLVVEQGTTRVVRGEVALNGKAMAPQRDGVWITGRLDRLDLDQWRRALPAAPSDASSADETGFPVAGIQVKVGEVYAASRSTGEIEFDGSVREGIWEWNVTGKEIAGTATWAARGAGRLVGRLSRLYIPVARAELQAPADGLAQRTLLPAMDITADDFRVGERQFGRLTLLATPQGPDWRIEQMELRSPDGVLALTGMWQAGAPRPATRVDVKAEVSDIGRYFARVKLPPGIKGGSGQLTGELSWGGPPYALDLPSLSGGLNLEVKRGQFIKVDPGIGKLIGVLSMQALPRRVTLDFRDVFSQGFTFDRISATASIDQGLARTKDFRMVGPAAKVDMKGEVNLPAETQRLEVTVLPSLTEGIALGAAIVNPAVGLATLIAQKALRDPFEKMVAHQYDITGTWNDPVVTKKRRPAPAPGPTSGRDTPPSSVKP
jgi:uncharacterized protein (TIGR02099 family)